MPLNEIYTDNEAINPNNTELEPNDFENLNQEREATKQQACEEVAAMFESCPQSKLAEPGKDGINCRPIKNGLYAAMQVLRLTRETNEQNG